MSVLNEVHGEDRGGEGCITLLLSTLVILLFLICPSTGVSAAERTITLMDAYRMALKNHEAVKISGERLFQSEKNLDKAKTLILPTLTAEGAYRKYDQQKTAATFLIQPDDTKRFDLVLSQPLYLGGRALSARRRARMEVAETKEALDATREGIIMDTSRAYFNLLKAGKDLDIKEAALKRAKERKKVAESRFRVGGATKAAVLREEAEVAKAEAELTDAERVLRNARDVLISLTGSGGDIEVSEPLIDFPLKADLEGLIATALERRRDYRRADIAKDIASEGIRYAKGNFLPTLKLEGAYSWRDQDPRTTFFQKETLFGGVVLTYPLFEGGLRRAELAEARSRYRERALERAGLRREIELEVRAAFNDMEALNAVIESYRRQVAFAEENYDMVYTQYKHGLATSVDVVDADTILVSAHRGLMNARYDRQVAILALKYRTGTLFDEMKGRLAE